MKSFNFFRGNNNDVPTPQEIRRSIYLTTIYEQGFRAGINRRGYYNPPQHYHASKRVLNTWQIGYRDAERSVAT